jgi:predicted LPLAT superfamily acyltransferase
MHRTLIGSFKYLNLRFVYLGMAVFVVPFYMLFAHKGYITMYHYFRQRHHYGMWKSFYYVYKNHYRFGQVILDRFAAYAGQHFQVERDGYDTFQELDMGESGFMILSCHVGNYELAGYTFKATQKRYNALIFSGEAETVMENRNRILSENNIRMVPVSEDMSHIFLMSDALAGGEIVSIPADRIFGSPRSVVCRFFGSDARFPIGPFMISLQRQVPTIAIFVMKESPYRYKTYIRRVEIDSREAQLLETEKGRKLNRQEQAGLLAQAFAREVETVLKRYPEQWFNYYEFWNQDGDKA